MQSGKWYPIRGFETPSEYRCFVQYIEARIHDGTVVEMAVDPACGVEGIYGGRWFRENATRRTWRLVEPDFPFRGIWEPVGTAGGG